MSYNISSYLFSSSSTAVNLVHSPKTPSLNEKQKEKIEKTLNHINYLKKSMPNRNTHGGSKLRHRIITKKNQIALASERLKSLMGVLKKDDSSNSSLNLNIHRKKIRNRSKTTLSSKKLKDLQSLKSILKTKEDSPYNKKLTSSPEELLPLKKNLADNDKSLTSSVIEFLQYYV